MSLFHVRVGHSQIANGVPKILQKYFCLSGRAKIRLCDNLQKRDPGAVQVHERRASFVNKLAGVLFQMRAGYLDFALLSFKHYLGLPTAAERHVILGDLITLRQIGIKIIFSVKFRMLRYLAPEREPDQNSLADCLAIRDRQTAGLPAANFANVSVRLCLIRVVRRRTKHFRVRLELNVDL